MEVCDKKESINSIKERLEPLFDSYNIKRAVLFGSTAKGTNTEKSDIDLVVYGNLIGKNAKEYGSCVLKRTLRALDNPIKLDLNHIIKIVI